MSNHTRMPQRSGLGGAAAGLLLCSLSGPKALITHVLWHHFQPHPVCVQGQEKKCQHPRESCARTGKWWQWLILQPKQESHHSINKVTTDPPAQAPACAYRRTQMSSPRKESYAPKFHPLLLLLIPSSHRVPEFPGATVTLPWAFSLT